MRDELLIERLKQHHADADTTNFNVLDFLGAFGSPLDALAYSKLFWPDFVEFEGMIFLADFVEGEEDRSRIRAAMSKFSTRQDVEKSFNQFMIPEIFFSRALPTVIDEENLYLAERIVEMWEARLARLFPSKSCVVELQLPDETQEGPTVFVYQP
jgi:hypothetical protein